MSTEQKIYYAWQVMSGGTVTVNGVVGNPGDWVVKCRYGNAEKKVISDSEFKSLYAPIAGDFVRIN